jgi:hypothetical protein
MPGKSKSGGSSSSSGGNYWERVVKKGSETKKSGLGGRGLTEADNSQVFEVRPDMLKAVVEGKKGPTVVMYYMNNCGACKRFAPVLKEALTVLKDVSPEVNVRKIDAVRHKDMVENECGIDMKKGYPMLYGHGGAIAQTVPIDLHMDAKKMGFHMAMMMNGDGKAKYEQQEEIMANAVRTNPGFAQAKMERARGILRGILQA